MRIIAIGLIIVAVALTGCKSFKPHDGPGGRSSDHTLLLRHPHFGRQTNQWSLWIDHPTSTNRDPFRLGVKSNETVQWKFRPPLPTDGTEFAIIVFETNDWIPLNGSWVGFPSLDCTNCQGIISTGGVAKLTFKGTNKFTHYRIITPATAFRGKSGQATNDYDLVDATIVWDPSR